jgi:TPR repeat protein
MGYLPSYSWLGWCYFFGTGVEKDVNEGLRWFGKKKKEKKKKKRKEAYFLFLERGGALNDPRSLYYLGESGEFDEKQTFFFYSRASQCGWIDAMAQVGRAETQSDRRIYWAGLGSIYLFIFFFL